MNERRMLDGIQYPPLNSIYLKLYTEKSSSESDSGEEKLIITISHHFNDHLKALVLGECPLSSGGNQFFERGSLIPLYWDINRDEPIEEEIGVSDSLDTAMQNDGSQYPSAMKLFAKVMAVKPFSKGMAIAEMTSIVLLDVTEEGQAKLDWIEGHELSTSSISTMAISNLHIFGSCSVHCMPISLDPLHYRYPQIEQPFISKIATEMINLCNHDSFAICSYEFLELHHLFHGDWIWVGHHSKKRKCQIFSSNVVKSLIRCSSDVYTLEASKLLFVNAELLYNVLAPSHICTDQNITSSFFNNKNSYFDLTLSIIKKENLDTPIQKVEFKRRATPLDGLLFDSACKALTKLLSTRKVYLGRGDSVRVQVDVTKSKFERMIKSRAKILEQNLPLLDQILNFGKNQKSVSIAYYFIAISVESATMNQDADETMGFIDSNSAIVSINPEPFSPLLPHEYPYNFLEKLHNNDEVNEIEIKLIDLFRMALNSQIIPSILLLSPDAFSKSQTSDVIARAAKDTGFQIVEIDCNLLQNETNIVVNAILDSALEKSLFCSPSILVLNRIDMVAKKSSPVTALLKSSLSLVFQKMVTSGKSVILSATSSKDSSHDLDIGILGIFHTTLHLTVPDQNSRVGLVNKLTRNVRLEDNHIDSNAISIATAGLNEDDLHACFANAGSYCFDRASKNIKDVRQYYENDEESLKIVFSLTGLSNQDVQNALSRARSHHSETIGAPKIPKVLWSDIGGLEHVKKTILETIQLPMIHPELFQSGAKKRSGILLYGPPGTGKTLIAKAVATSLSLNFLSVKGPELLNMYIGESEHNVRQVFQKAKYARPCIIFFDEMESVAPARGEKGDSSGVMDRIVSQLLAEIDGMNNGGNGDIFVIGATNRPDLLDPALLRPGRFDKLLYLGVCPDHKAQTLLLKALTREFNLADDFDLEMVANQCPLTLTGADLYALCTDANLKAISRSISVVDEQLNEWNLSGNHQGHPFPASMPYFLEHICDPDLYNVQVTLSDFEDALKELQPSLSREELVRYENLRSKFEGAPIVVDRKGKGKAM